MHFVSISLVCLAVAALADANRDFSGNFGGDSGSRLLTGGFGARGFGGRQPSAYSKASSFGLSGARFASTNNDDDQDDNDDYDYDRSADFRSYGNDGASGLRAYSNGFSGNSGFSGLRAHANGYSANSGLSGLRAYSNGFSGNSGYSGLRSSGFGHHGLATFGVSRAASVPAVLVAFPSISSLAYTGFPANGGFSDDSNDFSYNGFPGYHRGFSGNGFSNAYGFSRLGGFDGSRGAASTGAHSGLRFSGANYRRNNFARQESDSAAAAAAAAYAQQSRSYNARSSFDGSDNNNAASSGSNLAFFPVVAVPSAGQNHPNQAGAASRHTKIVRTTITTESDRDNANRGSVGNNGLRTAVLPVPVVTGNFGSSSGSYGRTSGGNSDSFNNPAAAAGYRDSSDSFGAASGFGGVSSSAGSNVAAGYGGLSSSGSSGQVAASRSFAASSSQAASSSLDDLA